MKKVMDISSIGLTGVCDYLSTIKFTPVKTKYISNGWSAVSLYGYGNQIHDILKPNVLGTSDLIKNELTKTSLYYHKNIKPIQEILGFLPYRFERIRIMKLKSGSTIRKHTDKVDKDFVNGKIVRFHLPLDDNNEVVYYVWEKGLKKEYRLSTGKVYHLDVRFPHSVKNVSNKDRYNLVFDTFNNNEIKELIKSYG